MRRPSNSGFTLVEVLVVLVTLVVLAGLLYPLRRRDNSMHLDFRCLNNIKNVGLAHQIFAMDNMGHFPMEIPMREGGSREWLTNTADLWRHFDVLSNELVIPKLLVCPADRTRTAASHFRNSMGPQGGVPFSGNSQLSYFLNLDARNSSGDTPLCGDAQMMMRGAPTSAGELRVDRSTDLRFARGLHHETGNLAFADGSGRRIRSRDLSSTVRKGLAQSGRPTNLWILP